jgi:hypothetical protein
MNFVPNRLALAGPEVIPPEATGSFPPFCLPAARIDPDFRLFDCWAVTTGGPSMSNKHQMSDSFRKALFSWALASHSQRVYR